MHTRPPAAPARSCLDSAVNAISTAASLSGSSFRGSDAALTLTSGCAVMDDEVEAAPDGPRARVSCSSVAMVGDSAAGMAANAAVQSSWSRRTCRLHTRPDRAARGCLGGSARGSFSNGIHQTARLQPDLHRPKPPCRHSMASATLQGSRHQVAVPCADARTIFVAELMEAGEMAPEAADLRLTQAQDGHELLHIRSAVSGVRRHQVLLASSLLLWWQQSQQQSWRLRHHVAASVAVVSSLISHVVELVPGQAACLDVKESV